MLRVDSEGLDPETGLHPGVEFVVGSALSLDTGAKRVSGPLQRPMVTPKQR